MMMPEPPVCATAVNVVQGLHARALLVPEQVLVEPPAHPRQAAQAHAQAVVLAKAAPVVPVTVWQVRSIAQAVRAIHQATPTATVVPLISPANFFGSSRLTQAGSPSL